MVIPIVVLALLPITARADWPVRELPKLTHDSPTLSCHEAGGGVVDGPGQPLVTPDGISCEAGVYDAAVQCGDYCGEFPSESAEEQGWEWDPQDSDDAERFASEARRWQERLERFSAAKVEDTALHRKRVIAYSRQLAEVSDALLERWGKLERRKAGPSNKSVRAMKAAWKDARKSALALLDEFEDD